MSPNLNWNQNLFCIVSAETFPRSPTKNGFHFSPFSPKIPFRFGKVRSQYQPKSRRILPSNHPAWDMSYHVILWDTRSISLVFLQLHLCGQRVNLVTSSFISNSFSKFSQTSGFSWPTPFSFFFMTCRRNRESRPSSIGIHVTPQKVFRNFLATLFFSITELIHTEHIQRVLKM